nr:GTPase HflX [uncultured Dethiosulfovibrio sp.]
MQSQIRRSIIVSIDRGDGSDERLLSELELLLENLDVHVVDQVIQRRRSPDPGTLIGKGKVSLLKDLCEGSDVDLIVSDIPLSPRQRGALRALTGREVWDRPLVIMKIFEERARTSEAKLQVELARCRYELPHLRGLGHQMSRLGGGIGTRGPGETEFEIHRRKLERRIRDIDRKLAQLEKRRSELRKKRLNSGIPVVSLVGYTNSGKSTLLRRMSKDEAVYVADALFATLDTAVRSVSLSDGFSALMVDTVGFIRDLPPSLISAFRTTLEETVFADLLMVLLDGTDPQVMDTLDVVRSTLIDVGGAEIPRVILLNKTDVMDHEAVKNLQTRIKGEGERVLAISAEKGSLFELENFLIQELSGKAFDGQKGG